MKKNKLLIGTLVSVLTIGLVTKGTSKIIKSQNGKTSIISTDAAEGTQLTFKQIEGGTWNPNISGSMYRYAVGFKETLTFSNSNAGSLFFTDEIEDAITVNGVSLKNVGGRLSNSLGNGWLFLELPTSLNQPSEQYGRPLVEFKNTKLFDKTYKLPNMKFYMEEDGALSHFIMDYLEIGWNNIDYNLWASSVATYSTSGIPNNGYILLLKGTNNGEEVYINDIMNQITDNYVVSSGTDFSYKSLIGSSTSNIASHITVNGVSINNIDGAILATQSARIWMFLPETVGVRPEVEILPGATLGRSGSGGKAMHYYVDPQIFRFDCFMGVNGYWSNVTAKKQIKDVNYSGIAWNGIAAQDYVDSEGNLEKGILLQFDQNLSSENFCVNCNDRMHNFLYGKYGSWFYV